MKLKRNILNPNNLMRFLVTINYLIICSMNFFCNNNKNKFVQEHNFVIVYLKLTQIFLRILQLTIDNNNCFKIICKRTIIISLLTMKINKHNSISSNSSSNNNNNYRILLAIKELIVQKVKLYKNMWNKQMMILNLM